MQDILIYWGIHTLVRTKLNPFPLEYRTWCLQWDLVPDAEKKEIVAILMPDKSDLQETGYEPKEGDESWTLSVAKPDSRILKYRKYFTLQLDFDPNHYAKKLGSELRQMVPVNLYFEYFEDETGQQLSKIDIYRFKTGESNPVIPFEPRSVVQLGPAATRAGIKISQDDSNTIAHFLEVIRFLATSSWYHSPPFLTFRTQDKASEIDSLFPNVHEIHEIALAVRQLYGSDQLFNRAVNCYSKICGDNKKVTWVGEIKKQFNAFLDETSFPAIKDVNVRQLLDAFLYGGRIAHANEQDKQELLHSLIKNHGRAPVIMAVQMSFRRVVDSARLILPVLAQDYFHWLVKAECPKPSLMSMSELLASSKEQVKAPDKTVK
jgi:hypothetical protein